MGSVALTVTRPKRGGRGDYAMICSRREAERDGVTGAAAPRTERTSTYEWTATQAHYI